MFSDCYALTSLDVSKFNTAKVTDMHSMFHNCKSLTSLEVSNFKTDMVTGMGSMFYGCSALTSLDVSNFNTANVTYMDAMFYGCKSLTTIYCNDDWQSDVVKYSSAMFYGCTNLMGAAAFNASKLDVSMANPTTGYFTKKTPTGISQTKASVETTVQEIYSLGGGRLSQMQRGVNIVKMSDGTIRKVRQQ